jgi:hypothetical protein
MDFPSSSGGITCANKLYITSADDMSIRRGTSDPSTLNIRPRIDLTQASSDAPKHTTLYVEENQQGCTCGARPRVDAGSGLMAMSVASGMFYGANSAISGVPVATSPYGVIPWDESYNPDDVHFAHDPDDDAHCTHITVLLNGWYTIQFDVSLYKSANNTYATNYIRCKKNNTIVVPGSQKLCATLLSAHGNCTSWKGLVYLNAGDTISVDCRELATTANDVIIASNGCSLYIKYEGPSL